MLGQLKRRLGLRLVVLDDGVQLLDLLVHVDAREDRLAAVDGRVEREDAELVRVLIFCKVHGADLLKDLGHGGRHEGREQGGCDADALEQVIEDGRKARLLRFILAEYPRGGLVDIFVRAGNELEDLFKREVQAGVLHMVVDLCLQRGRGRDQVGVELALLTLGRERAAEVLVDHRDGAGNEVAQSVRKVGVDAVDHDLIGEGAVRAQRHLAHDVVADRVNAVALAENEGIDDIAEGFRHFLTVEGDPAVHGEVLGERFFDTHEHRRPDDRVEAHDIFRDHVDVRRPELAVIVVGAVVVAQRGDIVRERVDPDVDDVTGVEGDRDAPGERGAGDAEILETVGLVTVLVDLGLEEVVDQFRRAGARAEVVGLGEELLDALRKGSHLHEVRFLGGVDDVAAAVGALAVLELRLRPEALAGGAVLALVFAFVDIALLIKGVEDLLNRLDVVVVGGADVAVVADVHVLPELLEDRDDAVDVLLGGDALGFRFFLYLLAVLIGTGQEHHVVALHPLVARDRVAGYRGIGMPDMGIARRIVDRGRDVKGLFLTFLAHWYSLL